MATGTYGTIRPADVSPTDVDIILNYTESRDVTNDFQLTKLNLPERGGLIIHRILRILHQNY